MPHNKNTYKHEILLGQNSSSKFQKLWDSETVNKYYSQAQYKIKHSYEK